VPFDQHKNLAISRIIAPPSPADLGTAVDIIPGEEARFPIPPFNVTIWPPSAIPTPANAEVARVTLIQNNRLFIERAVEGTVARSILIGDFIAETVTAKALLDIENAITSLEAIVANGPVALHATQHEVGGSDPIDGDMALANVTVNSLVCYTFAAFAQNIFAPDYRIEAKLHLTSQGDGQALLTNDAGTDFSLLQFGGTTSAFPALLRNGNNLAVYQADSSGLASIIVDRVKLGFSGLDILQNAGTPEGNVTAPVGALYLRRDGGIGTTLYVKQSGAATATGWLPVANVGAAPSLHAPTHAAGGTDPVTVTGLAGYPGGTTTFLRADGTFSTLPAGAAKVFRTSHSWALVGDVSALTNLPVTFIPLVGTQTARIVGVRAMTFTGTITAKMHVNGTPVAPDVAVTTTPTTTAFNTPVTNDTYINWLLSAPAGGPTMLTLTVYLEHTV
jgi:hypothetical protein